MHEQAAHLGAAQVPAAAPRGPSLWADRVLAAATWLSAALVVSIFLWIVFDLLRHGLPHLSFAFLVEAPRDGGRAGGIGPVLVATGLILAVCLAASVPLGLGTAIFLAEIARRDAAAGRWVRRSLDVLAGTPSIVFGLFGNAFFSVVLGLGFSILAGGLTLACMVLPILVRTLEQALREVPDDYRMAGAALGLTRPALVLRILLPAAAPGLAVGLALGIGRALAETAALLFTSGYVARMPGSLLDSGRALSVHVYDLAMNVPGGSGNAYATALVLVVLLVAINGVAGWLAGRALHRRIV
jgi:phosphate transport system permease protein